MEEIGAKPPPTRGLRALHRKRLRYLLDKLVKRRNWVDASGVLSVLLKATCKERLLHSNRVKYWATIELLRHVESHHPRSKDIGDVYHLWMTKTAPKMNRPWKDKFVLFDCIVSLLVEKNYDGARSFAICLRQDAEADNDPTSNFILGLCYYELWYRALPEHRQLIDMHEPPELLLDETENPGTEVYSDVPDSEDLGTQLYIDVPDSEDPGTQVYSDVPDSEDTNSGFKYHPETSVMNDEVQRVMANHQSRLQGLYIKNPDLSGSEGDSPVKRNTNLQWSSALNCLGVPDRLLFPIQWDSSKEQIHDVLQELRPNDDYKDAVQYLRKALNSTPGVEEALLPLLQILLLNDRLNEALDELEEFCYSSRSLFASRLKTHFFECLGCNNPELLFSWYEEILKKDPTCKHSITKLVQAYEMGDYGPDRLLEMIALHLDASFGEHDLWREFASCLQKVCGHGGEKSCQEDKKTPSVFLKGAVGKNWKLRCKWWLNRHFSKKLLASERAAGEMLLMAYKAACASQMYGPGLHYVVGVGTLLKEEKDPHLFMVLNTFVQISSSSGFYPELLPGGGDGSKGSLPQVFSCVGTTMAEEDKTRDDEEEEGGERGDGDKDVARRRGRPKAQPDKGKTKKRGRPRKELADP